MSAPDPASFDIGALFSALDSERRHRQLSWQQVTREINDLSAGALRRPLSSSTLARLQSARVAEADTVLQILLWLRRTAESFMSRDPHSLSRSALPQTTNDQILRIDTRALYAALDAQRKHHRKTWAQVAGEMGGDVTGPSLTRLAKGGRTSFPSVLRIVRWLRQPLALFVHAFPG